MHRVPTTQGGVVGRREMMRVSNELMRLVLSRMHKIQCVVCITRLLE